MKDKECKKDNKKKSNTHRIDFHVSDSVYNSIIQKREANGYSNNKDFIVDLVNSRTTTDRRLRSKEIIGLTNLNYLLEKAESCDSFESCNSCIIQAHEEVDKLWKAIIKCQD